MLIIMGCSAVYEVMGQTVMRNKEYYAMVPPKAQVFFGREYWTCLANGILHFHRIV